MNKTAIKNYAMQARRDLIKAVCQKAYDIGVTPEGAMQVTTVQGGFIYNGVTYGRKELEQRTRLVDEITRKSDKNDYAHGYKIVMEEVAYTWFNRFIALRFMEVNGYLPSGVSILSSENKDRLEPDCIRKVEMLDFVDMSKVADFKDDTSLYKYILTAQCNALSSIMPKMFQRIENYTELLLPDSLYQKGGLIYDLVHADIDFTEQVEVIGWLYQYYNEERKDEVINIYKGTVKKEDIPAATQLFTTDWVVRYMVDNSLGKYWIQRNPNSKLKEKLEYFISDTVDYVDEKISPIDIKVIDPCVGSGHILVYAFDVLYNIYLECGYSERDIPKLILENNLYGIDIDDRAYQIAYFAVMMKARKAYNRFFRDKNYAEPKVYNIIETASLPVAHINALDNSDLSYLVETFKEAKDYGSIIKIEKEIDFDSLMEYLENFKLENDQISLELSNIDETIETLKNIVLLAKSLTSKYEIVVTNPPYLNKYNPNLKDFVTKNYKDYSGDLFSVFMYKNFEFCKKGGYSAFMTPFVWMFIKTYEKLREYIVNNKNISSLIQMEYSAFEEATVPICTFVLKNEKDDSKGDYIKLSDFKGGMEVQRIKTLEAINNKSCGYYYKTSTENFEKIPGMPVAYWVSENILKAFGNTALYEYSISPSQNITGNNNKYVRKHWEIKSKQVGGKDSWIFYAKGGGYRKWWGNLEDIINWTPQAREIYQYGDGSHASQIINKNYWYKKGITWGLITSNLPSFRVMPEGATFDKGGSTIIVNEEVFNFVMGLLNSKLYTNIASILNPTLNFQVKDIRSLPLILNNVDIINNLVTQNIEISKTDWDSFETSWDFKTHPLILHRFRDNQTKQVSQGIDWAYKAWEAITNGRFNNLKSNEEELNKIFIDIYGLQDELTPEVLDKDVTIRKADLVRDIKSFVSYAVGCMFGRYSPLKDGLVYAGGEWDYNKIQEYLFKAIGKNDFSSGNMVWSGNFIDPNNILPITGNDYFDDDIVSRFIEFVKAVYGAETLDQNLQFIANALYPTSKDSARQSIRRYFLNDFYKDHIKTYQKRPIYWQFSSGKQDGFKALVYLHRYDKYTVARVRTDYLHPLQRKYEAEIKRLEMLLDMDSTNPREVAEYKKQIADIVKKIDECRIYDQAIAHIAHQAIELDLDDGVTQNYAKFQNIEVPQGDGKPTLKMDLLGKI